MLKKLHIWFLELRISYHADMMDECTGQISAALQERDAHWTKFRQISSQLHVIR